MKYLALLLACMALAACKNEVNKPAQPVSKVANTSQQPEPFALQAFDAFVAACPVLARSEAEVSDWKFAASALSRIERDFGWSRAFDLSFRVVPQPREQALHEAAGNTCTFTLGGGDQPGYFAERDHCAKICGIATHSKLAPVPAMAFLDEPDSPGYKARRHGLDLDLQVRVKSVKSKAMDNDYQAQRALAAIYANESYDREDRIQGCAWRMVIVNNHAVVEPSDNANLTDDCAGLSPHEKDAAAKVALALSKEIRRD
ncbi:hypothetical protein [uncultured Oxalicibacterium sp.]|uniref:hypothetical protein n=1 Tax=uncultured Oxalicibacterium sp. TaxID=1168540 RepID=UPI0025DC5D9C|nr:hypothetical protein [uncultured Oxalicibacterium sp.]